MKSKKLERKISNLEKEIDERNKIRENEFRKLKLEKEIMLAEMESRREALNPNTLPLICPCPLSLLF